MFSIDSSYDNTRDSNYIEVVLINKEINPFVYDVDFSETRCSEIIKKITASYPQCKVFKKHNTKYVYGDLELTSTENDNTFLLYQNNIVLNRVLDNKFLVNYYKKQPLPTHCFPSTTNLTDTCDSKRVTIKMTNNIYMNFESLEYTSEPNKQFRHIYLNININKSSDIAFIEKTVNDIITLL